MLDDLKHHSKTVGLKQTIKALEGNKAQTVYIAKDAEEKLVSKVIDICSNKEVKIYKVESMKILGKKCGIDVGTAVAAIIND